MNRPDACRLGLIALALFLALAPRYSAAQEPGAADPLKDTRNKDAMTDENRTKLTQFVDAQIAAIQSGDRATVEQGVRLLRDGRNGSNAFREAYAAACIRAVGGSFKAANLGEAVQLIAVLNELNEATSHQVLIEALADERAAVRTAAAVGLRKLRPKISIAGGKFFSESLDALRDAALKESSALALKSIYQALNYPEAVPNPPEPKAIVEAVLVILESRAEQYVSGKVRAEAADVQGLKTAAALKSFMGPAEQKRLTVVLGKMLCHAVRRYTSAPVGPEGVKIAAQIRRDLELLIIEAEKQLTELVPPPAAGAPSVTKPMEKVEQTLMKIEFNKWADLLKKSTGVEFDLQAEQAAPAEGGG